jgi:N-acetylglucosaminyldiphosphoundecaprenol N-acetyl-beta-D-mannosaminyltransferase
MACRETVAEGIRTFLFGVPIDCLTTEEALERLKQIIRERIPQLIVTADAACVVQAQKDPAFMRILQSAAIITADGSGVSWALRRFLGKPIQRVSGVDLVAHLCALSAREGFRIFLLGAEPGVAEQAAGNLVKKYPGCQIVGTHHGYFDPSRDREIAEYVAKFKPDILLVALGMPRQEKFIDSTKEVIRAPVAMGIGGSLDVFSGKTRRAPRFMRKLGVEWMWRLMLDPTKIKKVRQLPGFALKVLTTKNENLHTNGR